MDDLFSEKPVTCVSGDRLKDYLDNSAQVSIEKTWIAAWDSAIEYAASICDGMADRVAAGEKWTPLGAVEECADSIRDGSNDQLQGRAAAGGESLGSAS